MGCGWRRTGLVLCRRLCFSSSLLQLVCVKLEGLLEAETESFPLQAVRHKHSPASEAAACVCISPLLGVSEVSPLQPGCLVSSLNPH